MEETPSTACCVSGFPVIHQQRVLLFGSVRCGDLDNLESFETSSENYFGSNFQVLDQGFGHGRAQKYRQHPKQHQMRSRAEFRAELQVRFQARYQQNSYQENHFLTNSTNYFTNLRGGASSQTLD